MHSNYKMPNGTATIASRTFVALTCLGLSILPAAAIAKGANAGSGAGAASASGTMQQSQSRDMIQSQDRTRTRTMTNCDGACEEAARVRTQAQTQQRHEFRKTIGKLNGLFGTAD